MTTMTKRERVAAALRGEPTDRPAWSLWRHFYAAESTADQLAERMLAWVDQYPFDLPHIPIPRNKGEVQKVRTDPMARYRGSDRPRPEAA